MCGVNSFHTIHLLLVTVVSEDRVFFYPETVYVKKTNITPSDTLTISLKLAAMLVIGTGENQFLSHTATKLCSSNILNDLHHFLCPKLLKKSPTSTIYVIYRRPENFWSKLGFIISFRSSESILT